MSFIGELLGGLAKAAVNGAQLAVLENSPNPDDWLEAGRSYETLGQYEFAARQYERAVSRFNNGAMNNLAVLLIHGKGVRKDPRRAVALFRQSAERGDRYAQGNLADCLFHGWGCPVDAAESARWMRKAAEQGNVYAMKRLALYYGQGMGVAQSSKAQRFWLDRAAQSGDIEAQEEAARLPPREQSEPHRYPAKSGYNGNWQGRGRGSYSGSFPKRDQPRLGHEPGSPEWATSTLDLTPGQAKNAVMVNAAFKMKMQERHPDAGGNHEGAAEVSQARDILLAIIEANALPRLG